MEGWVKIHRKICGWEWFTEPFTAHLFIYLLLNANREEKVWRGQLVMPGQIITGRDSLSANTGLSPNQVRTSIERLKKTGEITSRITNKFSIITIIKWEEYQLDHQQTTSKPPANHQQTTTTKKDKKEDKDKNTPLPPDENHFDEFWAVYPKKVDKPAAVKAYRRAITRTAPEEIYDGARIYASIRCPENKRFTKNPATWLNNDCWNDNKEEIKMQGGLPLGWKRAGI